MAEQSHAIHLWGRAGHTLRYIPDDEDLEPPEATFVEDLRGVTDIFWSNTFSALEIRNQLTALADRDWVRNTTQDELYSASVVGSDASSQAKYGVISNEVSGRTNALFFDYVPTASGAQELVDFIVSQKSRTEEAVRDPDRLDLSETGAGRPGRRSDSLPWFRRGSRLGSSSTPLIPSSSVASEHEKSVYLRLLRSRRLHRVSGLAEPGIHQRHVLADNTDQYPSGSRTLSPSTRPGSGLWVVLEQQPRCWRSDRPPGTRTAFGFATWTVSSLLKSSSSEAMLSDFKQYLYPASRHPHHRR